MIRFPCQICGQVEIELPDDFSPPHGSMYAIACEECIKKAQEDVAKEYPPKPPEVDYWHK